MRINYFPLSILLVALSSHISLVRASNSSFGNSHELSVELNKRQEFFQEIIPEIRSDCIDEINSSSQRSLQELADQLMNARPINPETDSFEWEMQRADALMVCKAPKTAQKVLQRIKPVTEIQNKAWSILFWKVSNASMDHFNASLALRRLAAGNLQKLDQELITVAYRSDGSPLTRLALDLLAEHERLDGRCEVAAKVLLAGRKSGALGASRISRVAQCLEGLSVKDRKYLLESALSDANADKAWWLAGDILRLHIMLDLAAGGDAQVLKKKLESFAKELDDRFTQWELIRTDNTREEERTLLENQLRSPRKSVPDV